MKNFSVSRYFPPLQYLGPANLITTMVIISGFLSTILFVKGHTKIGLTLIILAIALDRLDGAIARKLNDHTHLGEQLDSLADALTFCFLPAFAAYSLGFSHWSSLIVLTLYVAAGLWRLAFFNIAGMSEIENKEYFIGIPTTICASWFVIISPFLTNPGGFQAPFFYLFFTASGITMISSIKYNKNGIWTKMLYVLLPLSLILLWV
ncbi:MAG: CDP-alcohol phosphatidyltransferase family protein [Bacillaceae bacterium]|nr:CDP-alcohol phosphatidyltransferase family protein [Bacillaceae bacterium]